jgi:hypothetical protein
VVAGTPTVAATSRYRRTVFWIQPQVGGDPLLGQPLAPQPKDFFKFDHRDLAIHPRLLAPGRGPAQETSIARSGEGGEVLKISPRQGGKVFKNLSSEGGKVLKKSPRKGP